MSDPLQTLESLRAGALQRARQVLGEAQREVEQRRRALGALHAAREACEGRLAQARTRFGGAKSVCELRWAADLVRGAELDQATRALRVSEAERALAAAQHTLREAEHTLREHEIGKRVVSKVIERRALAHTRRLERIAEDEADDALRTRQA